MRLKDADKLVEILDEEYRKDKSMSKLLLISFAKQILSDAPTIEAEPVRHGHWEDKYGDGDWHCSICGAIVERDEQGRHNWNRCYHCGAKMDEVKDETDSK